MKDKYLIATVDGFSVIEGKVIELPELPGIKFGLGKRFHRSLPADGWAITHLGTGKVFATGETKAKVKAKAKSIIAKQGTDNLTRWLRDLVRQRGGNLQDCLDTYLKTA